MSAVNRREVGTGGVLGARNRGAGLSRTGLGKGRRRGMRSGGLGYTR